MCLGFPIWKTCFNGPLRQHLSAYIRSAHCQRTSAYVSRRQTHRLVQCVEQGAQGWEWWWQQRGKLFKARRPPGPRLPHAQEGQKTNRPHTSAYVSIRIRQLTSAYASIPPLRKRDKKQTDHLIHRTEKVKSDERKKGKNISPDSRLDN